MDLINAETEEKRKLAMSELTGNVSSMIHNLRTSIADILTNIEVNVDYNIDDAVRVSDGPLKDFIGTVKEINKEKHKVKVLVSMIGRETPVELEFSQVQKVK